MQPKQLLSTALASLLLFSSAFFFDSCSKKPKARQTLRINIETDPQTLDPRKARMLTDITFMHMLFEGLTRFGKDGAIELALAEKASVSSDGLRYTFRLRDSCWSNGESVSSYDFANTWKKVLDPKFPSPQAHQLYCIKGARDLHEGKGTELGVQTPDETTLIIELEHPIPYFLEMISAPIFFATFSGFTEDLEKYVCNGPFTLKTFERGDVIEVVRNPLYWDADQVTLPGIDLVMVNAETELKLFEEGELDWAGSPISALPPNALSDLKQRELLKGQDLSSTRFLRVNTLADKSPLSSPLFRKALALAIDRQAIAGGILPGGQQRALEFVPPKMGLSSNGYFADGDLVEAKRLLSLYLKESGKLLEDLPEISLLYASDFRTELLAQVLQQQLQNGLGIRISVDSTDRKTFYDRLFKQNYHLAVSSWIADFNDPINFLEIVRFKEGCPNYTGWEHPKYIEWLNQSDVCMDLDKRKHILRNAELLLMDEMPIIPIYHDALNYLEQSGIKDVALSPIGQIDFRWVHR